MHKQWECKEVATEEKHETEEVKVQVAKYEVEAKARVQVGESIGGSDASSDTKVGLVKVETKVSDSFILVIWSDPPDS